MLRETGKIVAIDILDGKKNVLVECVSKSACKSCANNNDCGVGIVSKGSRNRVHQITIPYKEGMVINETVELLIDNSDIIKSSLLVYIVPLIFFVIAATIGYVYLSNEPLVIMLSVISLILGVFFAKVISSKLYPRHQANKLISTE